MLHSPCARHMGRVGGRCRPVLSWFQEIGAVFICAACLMSREPGQCLATSAVRRGSMTSFTGVCGCSGPRTCLVCELHHGRRPHILPAAAAGWEEAGGCREIGFCLACQRCQLPAQLVRHSCIRAQRHGIPTAMHWVCLCCRECRKGPDTIVRHAQRKPAGTALSQ